MTPIRSLTCHREILLATVVTFLCSPLPAQTTDISDTASNSDKASLSPAAPSGSALNATPGELAGILTPSEIADYASRWEKDIANLEQLDQSEPAPEDAILLLGSSSIRLWNDAAESLSPYPVIRRGYGGARYSDLVVFARRLITPHDYRALVIFVANDITGGENDRSVSAVGKMVKHVLTVAREHQPAAPVFLVEVTPTPSRFHVWPKIRDLNAMLRELSLTTPNVYFIPTAESYLTADDQPRADLFRDDRLHQNEAGYEIWARLIRRHLDDVLTQAN